MLITICMLSVCFCAEESGGTANEQASSENNEDMGDSNGRPDLDGVADTSNPLSGLGSSSSSGNRDNDQPQVTQVKTVSKKPVVRLNVSGTVYMNVGRSLSGIRAYGLIQGDEIQSWTSSNKRIVTVKKSGKLTAKKAGTAVITVRTRLGAKAVFTVVVKKPTIKVNRKDVTLYTNQGYSGIRVSRLVRGDRVVSRKSTNDRVVRVDYMGRLQAGKPGYARIIITTKYGAKAVIRVKVIEK